MPGGRGRGGKEGGRVREAVSRCGEGVECNKVEHPWQEEDRCVRYYAK